MQASSSQAEEDACIRGKSISRTRPGVGELAPAEMRSKENIPEASDTSGWEIAADTAVVQVAADRQEYRRRYGPKFACKAIIPVYFRCLRLSIEALIFMIY